MTNYVRKITTGTLSVHEQQVLEYLSRVARGGVDTVPAVRRLRPWSVAWRCIWAAASTTRSR